MSPLAQAIAIWSRGQNISLVLFAKLVEEGFDVPALERAYRR